MKIGRQHVGLESAREPKGDVTSFHLGRLAAAACLAAILCLHAATSGFCQTPAAKPQPAEPQELAAPATAPPAATNDDDQPLPGDWGPELLYGILNSPNEEAQFGLLRATFAAGPAVIPQLVEALKDDRTAEFAAQSIAYIGSEKALPVLESLLSDPRDLNLRRFTYGALGEFESPKATDILFEVINKSDAEEDRTVTEAAVVALTVRTDQALASRIVEAEKKLQDIVIRDDLDNARLLIQARAKYLASPQGIHSGETIDSAVRTYFLPALDSPVATPVPATSPLKKAPVKSPVAPAAHSVKPLDPLVSVEVRNVTLSPDKNRALARVVFQDPTALAYYDFVLEKREGNWNLASVWLGPEVDKTPPEKIPAPSDK